MSNLLREALNDAMREVIRLGEPYDGAARVAIRRALAILDAAQLEPDERVRELQRRLDCYCDEDPHTAHERGLRELARYAIDELRRLQAAQREPVAEVVGTEYPNRSIRWFTIMPPGTKLYTQAQRDDHPTEGRIPPELETAVRYYVARAAEPTLPPLCRDEVTEAKQVLAKLDAALAASKGTPDSMGQGQPLPSLSAVAQWQPIESAPRDETQFLAYTRGVGVYAARWLSADHYDNDREARFVDGWSHKQDVEPTHWMPLPEPPKDVRSQATDTQGREATVNDDQDQVKPGFVLVPVEPTEHMAMEGAIAVGMYPTDGDQKSRAARCYEAMLAARPEPTR